MINRRLTVEEERKKKKKKKGDMACWWQHLVGPLRRVWFTLSSRLHIKRHRNGNGLLKLHDDVQTCEYQDVQVMWEMLRRTELDLASDHLKSKRQPSWSILV